MNIKHNIIANFAGRAWSALMALAFLPLYLRFLGVEAYGLIGFYVSIMALFAVLDMGLSVTLNRELARLSVLDGSEQEARDVTRTFEFVYWGAGIVIGAVIFSLAPFIAGHWINAQGVPVETMQQAIMLMGLTIALQWPVALYSGGLAGLQRQTLLNAIRSLASTIQAGGAVLVLWLISPTILAYFIWQSIAGSLHTVLLAWFLWRFLRRKGGAAAFRKSLLIKHWRFTGGVAGTTLLVAALTQADKIVLSKMLSLEMFGYYSLSVVVAGILTYVSNPVSSALFPRFSQVVSSGTESDVALLYHKGSQLMALLIFPLWIVIALFSKELLGIWLGDTAIVTNTFFLVSLLATGTALNAIMFLPYTLQLAYGWTRLTLYTNVMAAAIFLPLLLWLVAQYGAKGAALAWIFLNVGYIVFYVPLMHRKLLIKSMRRWYLMDFGLPLGLSIAAGLISRLTMPLLLPAYMTLLWIGSTFALTALCVAWAMPHTRDWLKNLIAAPSDFNV
jgi:O-antigen/teichoic acid export membrane protein